MQTQPRFTVVTFVLVTLTMLALLSKLLAPYVVAPVSRRLANDPATFIQSGAREHVSWYPVSDLAFQDARRLDRPILLVVGAPWSFTGRRMDSTVFGAVTVQKLLARNFICIRADAVETPEWMAAFLPIGRAQLSLSGDYQAWMLDSQARLFLPVATKAQDVNYGETQFTNELVSDLSKLQDARAAESQLNPPDDDAGPLQAAELARLTALPETLVPALSGYRDGLLGLDASSPLGGFPINQRQRLWPDAWGFLLACAGSGAVAPTVDRLLRSPTRDMLDGGFFFGSRDATWDAPSYDKVSVLNAEMCLLLTQLAVAGEGSTPYARFAGETFDSLTGEFVDSSGLIRPCRIGDERANVARSQHSSFNPRQVRSLLDGIERDWAQAVLHLRPATNPAMSPYISDFSQLDTPMFNRVVPKLKGFGAVPAFDDEVTLSTMGATVARLLQAARLLHDSARIQRAHEISGRLDLFRRGTDVVHELGDNERAKPLLTDYLALADAELQDFLVSSRVETIQIGAAVLARALNLFAVNDDACYRTARLDEHHVVPDSVKTPQICDDTGESANAAVIRLTWAYGQLLRHSSTPADRSTAERFLKVSAATVTRFADIAPGLGPYAGGYATACALTTDDTIILCSGPDPVAMANDFAPKSPLRLVVPVAGPVYPEFIGKPGYYVLRHGTLVGPLTEAHALKLLPPTLFIGG